MLARFSLACTAILLTAGIASAQSREPDDSWLMQNYHFSGPPPAQEMVPADPVISGIQQVQEKTLAILRKAYQDDDLPNALAAASQAAANMQLLGLVSGRMAPPTIPRQTSSPQKPGPTPPPYLIVLREGAPQPAVFYWKDRFMFHYLTPAGAHEQVRLDLVERVNRVTDQQ
ncbi:MAG TPA: hypothetical protein VFA33_06920 [Bryobacteraceae bacterium]|nr:hypothetical protein [Bryobacteraceae bacterium]